jgi:hypothetical protein
VEVAAAGVAVVAVEEVADGAELVEVRRNFFET